MDLVPRRSGLIRYQWQEGLPFCLNLGGGVGFPQVYCTPIDPSSTDSEVLFSDDIIFRQGREGIFQLVVLLKSLSELGAARLALQNVDKLSEKYVVAEEATFIVQSTETQNCNGVGIDVFHLATPAEFASSPLCRGRAEPEFYDMYKLKEELRGKRL